MKSTFKNMIIVIIICFSIIFYGFIVISGNLPKFIKDRTYVKINYSLKPFDFRFNIGEYSLYINNKVIVNIKNGSYKAINNVQEKVCDNTSSIISKTSSGLKNVGEKINNTIQHKVR